jgi:hypothetical protein
MGIANSPGAYGVLGVRADGAKDRLLIFNITEQIEHHLIETKYNFSWLLPSHDLQSILGLTINHELVYMKLSLGNGTNRTPHLQLVQPIQLNHPLNAYSRAFVMNVDKQDIGLVVCQEANNFRLYGTLLAPPMNTIEPKDAAPVTSQSHEASSVPLNAPSLNDLGVMPTAVSWSIWAEHVISGALFVAGKEYGSDQWLLRQLLIQLSQEQQAEQTDGNLSIKKGFNAYFPDNCIPKEIFPLANNQVLILDIHGNLFYWDLSQSQPRLLEHPEWQKRPTDCTVRVGADGWFAVIVGNQLSMWQVRVGEVLRPYKPKQHRNFLIVKDVEKDSLRATPDGKYLLGIGAERTVLATWEFPRYAVDQL